MNDPDLLVHAVSVTALAVALSLEGMAAWCAHVPTAREVFQSSRRYLYGLPGGPSQPVPVPLWLWLWGKRRWNGHFGPWFPDAQWADPKSTPVFRGVSRLLIAATFLGRFIVGAEPPWEMFA